VAAMNILSTLLDNQLTYDYHNNHKFD